MSKTIRKHHWEPSAEIRAAAQTRLPLRLPRPEDTGLQKSSVRYASNDGKVKSSRPSQQRLLNRSEDQKASLPLTDGELEAMAQRVLLQSGISGFTRLHAEVRDGVATLYGTLPTEFERQLAVQLVRRVNGLNRVDHEISVDEVRQSAALPIYSQRSRRHWLWAVAAVISVALIFIGLGTFLVDRSESSPTTDFASRPAASGPAVTAKLQ